MAISFIRVDYRLHRGRRARHALGRGNSSLPPPRRHHQPQPPNHCWTPEPQNTPPIYGPTP